MGPSSCSLLVVEEPPQAHDGARRTSQRITLQIIRVTFATDAVRLSDAAAFCFFVATSAGFRFWLHRPTAADECGRRRPHYLGCSCVRLLLHSATAATSASRLFDDFSVVASVVRLVGSCRCAWFDHDNNSILSEASWGDIRAKTFLNSLHLHNAS